MNRELDEMFYPLQRQMVSDCTEAGKRLMNIACQEFFVLNRDYSRASAESGT